MTPEIRHRGFIYTTFSLGASHTGLWAGPGQKACLACPAGRVGRPQARASLTLVAASKLLEDHCLNDCW